MNLQTATRLQNGKVLVAGGISQVKDPDSGLVTLNSTNKCWLFDPEHPQAGWTETGALSTARDWHSATLLQNGKVLVVGGEQTVKGLSQDIALKPCELYDPTAGSWTAAGELSPPRNTYMGPSFTATPLPNGKVLVAGGILPGDLKVYPPIYPKSIADCVLYDPSTNSWSPAASLHYARAGHSATLLSDDPSNPNYGKVLVAGGNNGPVDKMSQLRNYEIYDTASNSWTCPTDTDPSKRLQLPCAGQPATLLKDGTVLLVAAGNSLLCQLYLPDPNGAGGSGDTWTFADSLNYQRGGPTVTRLNNDDGWVLVTGGGPNQCELFKPKETTLPAGVSAPVRKQLPGK